MVTLIILFSHEKSDVLIIIKVSMNLLLMEDIGCSIYIKGWSNGKTHGFEPCMCRFDSYSLSQWAVSLVSRTGISKTLDWGAIP